MENGKVLWEMSAGADAAGAAIAPGRFEKELLRVGRWAHPAGKFVLEVTRERLARWVEGFRRMLAKGIRVPVPYGHSYDARDNAGFVREMRVEGDRLIGVIEIPREEDAARLGSVATDVSVSVNPEFVDGQGERLGEVIEHVAITNYPIVPGQANFVPLAAEGGGEVIRLEMERPAEAAQSSDAGEYAAPADAAGEGVALDAKDCQVDGAGVALDAKDSPVSAEREGVALEAKDCMVSAEHEGVALDANGCGAGVAPERHALIERISELERARVDGEVESLLLSGRIAPVVEGHVRRLLAAEDQRVQLAATGETFSPAQELRAIFAAMPAGAWVPLEDRAGARPVTRRDFEVSDERAKQLAMENVQLLKKGGQDGEAGGR